MEESKRPVVDKRATNAIKICINSYFKNKSSLHLDIARLIAMFSHASVLQWGSVFEDRKCNFLIVAKLKSPFFAKVTYVPPHHIIPMTLGNFYSPDWKRASDFHIKKVFDPFGSRPYLKRRGCRFFLQRFNFATG